MGKRIGESTADDSHCWIIAELSTTDDVTKYRGISVLRYFEMVYYRRAFPNTAHP